MSDGPHRTLPLRPHWRDVAERAANPACPLEQVLEAVMPALRKELADGPLIEVCEILQGQASLFGDERTEKLEGLRADHRGSAAAERLIDCAVQATSEQHSGEEAKRSTIENAAKTLVRDTFRSMEEHYQREGSAAGATFLRGRLEQVRSVCDFAGLAGELSSGARPGADSLRVQKHDGVDEGPPLS